MGHFRTKCVAAKQALSDHFVGAGEQGRRHGKAKRQRFRSKVQLPKLQERRYLINAAIPSTSKIRMSSQMTPIPHIIPDDISIICIIPKVCRPVHMPMARRLRTP
jgi:hypothetical protein